MDGIEPTTSSMPSKSIAGHGQAGQRGGDTKLQAKCKIHKGLRWFATPGSLYPLIVQVMNSFIPLLENSPATQQHYEKKQ